nr:hypothetical protein [Thiolapillus sp.]
MLSFPALQQMLMGDKGHSRRVPGGFLQPIECGSAHVDPVQDTVIDVPNGNIRCIALAQSTFAKCHARFI